MKIGLQLYSIKEEMEKDFYGTLKNVAEAGYDGVEFAGYYGHPASAIKKALDELGLEVCSTHINVGEPEKLITFEKELGNTNLVHPHQDMKDEEQLKAAVDMFRNSVKVLTAEGFNAGYHNHAFEFEKINGKYILDILFLEVPELICEIDVFWAAVAGVDPAEYLSQYKGRIPLVHIKDLGEDGNSTEIGSGRLDMSGIINAAKEGGTKWLIVEQEYFAKYPQMESIKISYNAVKEMINLYNIAK